MAGMNTLQIIKSIPEFDGGTFIEWTRLSKDILQISWHFLSRITSGLERPISRSGSREGMKNSSDFDENDSNPSEIRSHVPGNLDEEPHNAWCSTI